MNRPQRQEIQVGQHAAEHEADAAAGRRRRRCSSATARVRSRALGEAGVSRASVDGAAIAAPTPCRARAASSQAADWASPPSSEATVNSAMPATKTRRRPRMSPGARAEQQQAAEGQGVGVLDPGEAGGREAEGGVDVGQGGDDHRDVEDDHQVAGEDDREHHGRVRRGGSSRVTDGRVRVSAARMAMGLGIPFMQNQSALNSEAPSITMWRGPPVLYGGCVPFHRKPDRRP